MNNDARSVQQFIKKYPYLICLPFVLLFVVYIIGLFIDVMDVDAAQYAAMSREMLVSKHYLQILDCGRNYLDKPPLIFWITSTFYAVFGVSNFVFKFPSLLFAILAIYSTYRFAKLYYGEQVAYFAALILASAQAFFIFVNDVRTDTMLTGAIIFCIWQLSLFTKNGKLIHVVLGFIGIGLAMLAKGPIGMMIPIFAFGTEIVLKRQWKLIFKWQWLMGLMIVALMLSPMLYGLYEQYGVKGPRFFLWTQSFGRITGESEWKNDSGYLFFVHNIAWQFLPWTLFLFPAIFWKGLKILREKFFSKDVELFSFGAFLLAFLALSLSKYKLPHYIYVLMPYSAILTASYMVYLFEARSKIYKWLAAATHIILIIIWLLALSLCTYFFPASHSWIPVIGILFGLLILWFALKVKSFPHKLIYLSVLTMVGANYMINASVYPELLKYQSDNSIGRWVAANKIPEHQFFAYAESTRSINFYSRSIVPVLFTEKQLDSVYQKQGSFYIRVEREKLTDIVKAEAHYKIDTIMAKPYFAVALLNTKFINPNSRASACRKIYLLHLSK